MYNLKSHDKRKQYRRNPDINVRRALIPGLAQRSRLKDACIIGIYLVITFVIALFIPSS